MALPDYVIRAISGGINHGATMPAEKKGLPDYVKQSLPVETPTIRQIPPGEFSQAVSGENGVPIIGTPEMSSITGGEVSDINETKSDVLTRAVRNLPRSVKGIVDDSVFVFTHPIKAAASIKDISLGIAELVIPGEQSHEKYAEQVGSYLKNRYGSINNIKNTFAEDPAGLVLDIASLMSGAGTVLKFTKFGKALQKVGSAVDPVAAGLATVKPVAKTIPKILPFLEPSDLYQRAAKFSTRLSVEDVEKITKTALENEIMPTVAGVEKTYEIINSLNKEIGRYIDAAVYSGKKIPLMKILRETKPLLHPGQHGALPVTAIKQVQRVRKELWKANNKIGRKSFTPRDAQTLKTKIYKDLKSSYSKGMETNASRRAQMAIARGARKAIEEIIPGIKKLNKKDGEFLALVEELEKSARRISNHDLISIRPALAAGAGGAIGDASGALAGLFLGVASSPKVQAKTAIIIDKLRRNGIKVNPTRSAVRLGIIESEMVKNEQNK